MALVKATVSTAIQSAMAAEFGAPADADKMKKFGDALADALITILTSQMTVTTTGVTAVGTPGGPLPIVAQPGTVT
jgi:hypothetical protein